MTPRDQVLAPLRELLNDKGVVARWVAIEALAAMKSVEDEPEDRRAGEQPGQARRVLGRPERQGSEGSQGDPTLGAPREGAGCEADAAEAPK